MTTISNEIKKALYKEKPTARLMAVDLDTKAATYETTCSHGEVVFEIPEDENENFPEEIPAQLLIRWIL